MFDDDFHGRPITVHTISNQRYDFMSFQSKRAAIFSPGHLAMFCLVLALLGPPTTITVTSQTCTPPTVTVLEIFPSTVDDCYKSAGARIQIDVAPGKWPVSWKFIPDWGNLDQKEPQFTDGESSIIEVTGYCRGGHFIEVCDYYGCCDTVAIELDQGPYCIDGYLRCVSSMCSTADYACAKSKGGVGSLDYRWYDADGNLVGTHDSLNFPERGYYTLRVIDDNGCYDEELYLFDHAELIDVVVKDVTCTGSADGSISFNTIGGTAGAMRLPYKHRLYDNSQPTLVPLTEYAEGVTGYDNLAPGTYVVRVDALDDNALCKTDYPFTIKESDVLLAVEAAVTAIIPCGATSGGAIEIEISGGTPEYEVEWFKPLDGVLNPADPLNPVDLEPGDYTVTVTDANGCSKVLSIEIEDPLKDPPIEITFEVEDYTSGQYGVDCWATIKAIVSGGVEPYSYEWSHYSAQYYDWFTNVPRPSGPITVTVIDARGCTMQATIELGACPLQDEDDNDRPDVFILPNPSGGAFTLRLDLSAPKDVSYNISDLYGFEILNVDLGSLGTGVFDFPVDINSEPNGQYYLQVLSTGNTANTVLVMKE